jgi:cytochrome c
MSRWVERSIVVASVAAACLTAGASAYASRYDIGRTATDREIAAWDIDVRPDGAGLPEGHGSVADGQKLYDAKCASCHGTFGESTDYIALAGGVGTLASDQPVRTTGSKLNYATTLFDYIRRAMPFNAPKTLTDDEVYALTAYVLNLNDIVQADATLDRASLIALEMPNRDGFTTKHGMGSVHGTPDTHATACMHDCVASVRIVSQLPDYAKSSHGDIALQTAHWVAAAASTGAGTPPASAVATRAGCMACHGVAKGVIGPAFVDIARKYHGDADAQARLVRKVEQGGSGVWGSAPMPGQSHVPADDVRAIVRWILGGASE